MLAFGGCGSASTSATTPAKARAQPAIRPSVEGARRTRRLGGRQLPTKAQHTFLVVKLRASTVRSATLDPTVFVHLLGGHTEYAFSQPGYAALNASSDEHLFFTDMLHAGRVVHGAVVFDAPLHGPLVLEFDTGQRIPVRTV